MSSKGTERKAITKDEETAKDLDKSHASQCPDPKIVLKRGREILKGLSPEIESETPCKSSDQDIKQS